MANWLDSYRQGSFRNVPFYLRSHAWTGGRRKTKFQYPGSDRIDHQDHGKLGKEFSLNVYLLGDSYYSDRNNLIDALDKEGPGTLVHPYYGRLTVEAGEYNVAESSAEGRMVRMTVSFSEVSVDIRTSVITNTQTKVMNARDKALLAIDEVFRKTYSVVRKPYAVIDNVQKTINVGLTTVQNAKSIYQAVAGYQDAVERVIDSIPTIFRDATQLAKDTFELLTFGTTLDGIYQATEENSREMFDDFIQVFGFEPEKFTDENDPAKVYADIIDQGTVVVAGSLLSVIDFTNYTDATYVRDIVFKEIDRIMRKYGIDDSVYTGLYDLKTEIFRDIEERIGDLSRISIVILPDPTPAIILSYQLYGTIDFEQQIIDRNNIRNPGFVPANVSIQVETIV